MKIPIECGSCHQVSQFNYHYDNDDLLVFPEQDCPLCGVNSKDWPPEEVKEESEHASLSPYGTDEDEEGDYSPGWFNT